MTLRYSSMTTRLRGLGSEKWALHVDAKARKRRGEDVILLTIGEPDILPAADLLDACARAMRAGRTGYSNGRGEPALLDAIAAKYARRGGRAVGAENVLCFPGTQTTLYAVMTGLVESGDEVLVGDPYYATYDGIVRATGATIAPVPLHASRGFRMNADDLAAAITPRTRVLLLNSPHNPTGAVLTRDDIADICAICERHDLWIVSDEVYEDLIFDGTFASPFDMTEFAERTIVASSISKSHAAPGFRSGWCVAPEEFTRRLLPLCETILFGNQPFIADATAYALTHPSDTAARMRQSYEARARQIAGALDGLCGIRCLPPQAGMFILADIRATGMSGTDFATCLLDQAGVAVMPGESFGASLSGWVRISLTVADGEIARAMQRMHDTVPGFCAEAAL